MAVGRSVDAAYGHLTQSVECPFLPWACGTGTGAQQIPREDKQERVVGRGERLLNQNIFIW
jgi:hypothetical protein